MLNFFNGKRVLITGNTGFKGSWLSEILVESGATVIGYGLKPKTKNNLFDLLGLQEKTETIFGDVRDFSKVKKTFFEYKPEIVFHLAAQPIVLVSYKKPRYTYETNVMGTVNVLEATKEAGCVRSFVNITTDKVYENTGESRHLFSEGEKLDGFDPYSNSKSCSELVTHSYKNCFFSNCDIAISTARAGNVIGGGDFAPNRIIPDCVRAAISSKPIEVRNKFSTRPYQFVLEPLFAYLLIAEKQYKNHLLSGYFNVGPDSDDFCTTGELVDLFCKKWGNNLSWVDHTVENAPHEASFLALDNSLIKKTLDWKPVTHIDEAIALVVEWSKVFASRGDVLGITQKQISCFYKRLKNECDC